MAECNMVVDLQCDLALQHTNTKAEDVFKIS
jgi:hypothetical protein